MFPDLIIRNYATHIRTIILNKDLSIVIVLEGMMNMKGIEHPAIYVSDLERSIIFYKKLGFKILRKTAIPHVMMYLDNDILEIIPRLEEDIKTGFSPPFPYHLGFYTDNLEEDVKRLSMLGIDTGPIITTSRLQLAGSRARILEHLKPEPTDPKLLGCMIPSEDENRPWQRVRFNDPDGIILEIWQRR